MSIGVSLTDLQTLFRRYVDDIFGNRITDATMNLYINEAQRSIQTIIDDADENFFSACQSYTVVADTDAFEFALPDNLKKVIQVERLMTSGAPVAANYVEFRKRHSELAFSSPFDIYGLTSSPQYYLRGAKIGVVAPSDSYTLRMWYTYAIPDLSSDNLISEIPAEFRNLIALQAAMLSKGERVGGAGALPDELLKTYDEGVERMRNYIESRQRQTSRQVNYIPDC